MEDDWRTGAWNVKQHSTAKGQAGEIGRQDNKLSSLGWNLDKKTYQWPSFALSASASLVLIIRLPHSNPKITSSQQTAHLIDEQARVKKGLLKKMV